MPFIPAVNTARCTVRQLYLAQLVTNTFFVRNSTAWAEASLIELGENIVEAWNAHVGPLQSNECQYVGVSIKDMTAETGFGIEHNFPSLSGGDRLGGGMPGNVALAVRLITGLSGRNFRGRMFLAATTEDQWVGNQLTNVAHAQIETNMRSLVQDINAGVGEVVIASFYEGTQLVEQENGEVLKRPIPRDTAILTPVLNVIVDPFSDSMRSRLEGRGK